MTMIAHLQKWYEAIEGKYADTFPVDLNDTVSKERVNNLIDCIDAYFEYQVYGAPTYFEERGKFFPPRFSRLSGRARLAFYQDTKKVLISLYGEDYKRSINEEHSSQENPQSEQAELAGLPEGD